MEMGLYGLLVICGSDGLEDERVGFIGFGAGLWWVVVVVFMKEGLGDIGLLTVSEGERKNREQRLGLWESEKPILWPNFGDLIPKTCFSAE
ncbi:hypothetical protein Peur_045157 [Populus x canadensis]